MASRRGLIGPAAGPLVAGVALPYMAAVDDDVAGFVGAVPAYMFASGAAALWWSARRSAGWAVLAARAGAAVLVVLGAVAGWAAGLDDGLRPLVPLLAGAAAGCAVGGTLALARTSRRALTVWASSAAAAAFLLARPLPDVRSADAILTLAPALALALAAATLALLTAPPPTPATPPTSNPPDKPASGSEPPDEAASGAEPPDEAADVAEPPGRAASGAEPPGEAVHGAASPDGAVGDAESPGSAAGGAGAPRGGVDGVEAPGRLQPGQRAAFGLVVLVVFVFGVAAVPGSLYAAGPVVTLAMLCGLGVAAILIGIAPDRRGAVYGAAAAPAVVALGWGGAESAMLASGGMLAVAIGSAAALAGTVIAVRLPERPRNLAVVGSVLVALGAAWWAWQPGWAGPEAYLAGAGLGGGLLLGALLRLRRPLAVGVLALAVCAAPVGRLAADSLGGGPTPPGAQTLGTSQSGSAGFGLGETRAELVPDDNSPNPSTPSSAGPNDGTPSSGVPSGSASGSGVPSDSASGGGVPNSGAPSGGGPDGGASGSGGSDGAASGGGVGGSGADGGLGFGVEDDGNTAAPQLGEERPYYGGDVSRGAAGYAPAECDRYEVRDGEYVCISEVPDRAESTFVVRSEKPASGATRPTGLLVVLAFLAGGAAIALLRRPRHPTSTPRGPSTPADPN